MRVEWYGQSAFRLTTPEATVFIDPFGDLPSAFAGRRIEFNYPPIEGVSADVVLLTHEHFDHNAADAIGGDPAVVRLATWPRPTTAIGEVVGIASEHDAQAGTQRGPNTIFRFTLDDIEVCHFGDFGQSALRDEQEAAIGSVDLLFLPVGGGPTIGAEQAADIAARLEPRWVVPMHYRTPRIGFLESAEAFLERMPAVERLDASAFETGDLPAVDGPLTVVPAAP
jgi:L-ascorbate metabolism protein UlaG (beta-lactamase superfamily)